MVCYLIQQKIFLAYKSNGLTFDSSVRCTTLHSLLTYNRFWWTQHIKRCAHRVTYSRQFFTLQKFDIKFRDKESKEDAKTVLNGLEKGALLLDLIPIAFNKELEGELQTFSLFVERAQSINIIWDFILAAFRFLGEPEGIAKCYFAEFKRLDKFFVENSTLPMVESEIMVDNFKYCVNISEHLRT